MNKIFVYYKYEKYNFYINFSYFIIFIKKNN